VDEKFYMLKNKYSKTAIFYGEKFCTLQMKERCGFL
jgi:hypothetical protein